MLQTITPNGFQIYIQTIEKKDYLSLTDLAKFKSQNSNEVIKDWIRQKSTLEFLTAWEKMYNPDFQNAQLHTFKKAKSPNYSSISPSKWIQLTNAIGIVSKRGRYDSGTYAHKDIALEFLTWLSPTFKLYVIQELQRLKEKELEIPNLANHEWQSRRLLSKSNYRLQTHAITKHILNGETFIQNPRKEYANEADLLNEVVFQTTAKQFREQNPSLVQKRQNIRDSASTIELIVLANMEAYNSQLIASNLSRSSRHELLIKESKRQFSIFYKQNKIT